MPTLTRPPLKPRKQPVQARSTASVEAIIEATIQVLLRDGRGLLTTSKVAARAGVSVGSLYQYFPNKSSLLQAALRAHLERVYGAVSSTCARLHGKPLRAMGSSLVAEFLEAKFEHIEMSLALYRISDDLEGAAIARSMGRQSVEAIAAMLHSSPDRFNAEPEAAASMLFAVMAGTSRRMLESADPVAARHNLEPELQRMVAAYLNSLALS